MAHQKAPRPEPLKKGEKSGKIGVREVKERMNGQQSFTDIEYTNRKRATKREVFLKRMNAIVPWDEWVEIVKPYYPSGKRGRQPKEIEQMLRMVMLQMWFNLSDEGVEDAIYDSYAMKSFMGINFSAGEQVPDATTLCKFRKLLNDNGLQRSFFAQVQEMLAKEGKQVTGGTIVDATIINAPESTKNKERRRDPEMAFTRKNAKLYFGMRAHIGVDPCYGFVNNVVSTAANVAECKVAPKLLRPDDKVVYGDAGYLKMDKYVEDGIKRAYRINRQAGTFKRHYNDSLSWKFEHEIERRKSRVRRIVEFAFHIAKDIFGWRKLRYKGIYKNDCFAQLLFACVNLYNLAIG